MLCHGQGNLDPQLDGCCWVEGAICPNRLKIVDGHVRRGADLDDLGSIAEYTRGRGGPRTEASLRGVVYACEAAVLALAEDPSPWHDRAGFRAAWAARPEYQPIADIWERLPNPQPRDWCMTYGPFERQCCFAETEAINQGKASRLSATSVAIRRTVR